MEVEKGLSTPGQTVWWYLPRDRNQPWSFIDVDNFPVKIGQSYYIQNVPSGNVLDFNQSENKVCFDLLYKLF